VFIQIGKLTEQMYRIINVPCIENNKYSFHYITTCTGKQLTVTGFSFAMMVSW